MKIKNLAKNWRHILFLSVLIQLGEFTQAQILTPNYPTPAEAVTRGYDQSLLTVQIGFTSACTDDTVTIQLPESVSYVAGSVIKTAGTGSFAIADADISNLRTPKFEITGVTGAGSITFTIAREAACGTAVSGKDTVLVFGSCGTSSESAGAVNTYNIFAPSLSLTPPAPITGAILGTTVTRTITVTNGGNGDADTMFFYVVYPNGGIENTDAMNQITANGTLFTPNSTSGDTLFYKIFGATLFGGDNLLTNGESITITEPILVLKCNTITSYAAGWGVDAVEVCQWATGTANVSMRSGVAAIGSSSSALSAGYVDKCTPFEMQYTTRNSGTGDDTAGGMFNVEIMFGYASTNSAGVVTGIDTTNNVVFDSARIGGNLINSFKYLSGIIRMDLQDLFVTDPDGPGGLTDLDGDGFFDDLPRGEPLVFTLRTTMKCNTPCGYYKNFRNGVNLTFDNMCGDSLRSDRRNMGSLITEGAGTAVGYVPANIQGGTPFRVSLDAAFAGGLYFIGNNANTRYRWKIVLPAGMAVSGTGNPTYNGLAITFTQVADTVYITSPSSSFAEAEIDLVYTCGTSGFISFPFEIEKLDNILTGCVCQSRLACGTLNPKAFCPSAPCPGGVLNYVPTVRRSDGSLGWTDNTMSTKQNAGSISSFDLSKALYLDTILVSGSGRQASTIANLHQRMQIARSGTTNRLAPIDMEVSIIRGGVNVASYTVTSATDNSSGTTQQVDWDLTSGLPVGGMLPNDSIVTVGRYVVSTNATMVQNDIQTGVDYYHFSVINGIDSGCNNFIPEMYLVGTYTLDGRNAWSASGCGNVSDNNSNIARRFNTAGTLFADEYRPGFYIDSVVVTFPTTFVAGNTSSSFGGAMTANTIIDNVQTFINPGTWRTIPITVTNSYGGWVDYPMTPTCETTSGLVHNVKFYIKDYYYALADRTVYPSTYEYILSHGSNSNNVASNPSGASQGIGYSVTGRPNFEIQNLTGDVVGALPQHTWDVEVRNTGLNTGPFYWVALEDIAGTGITIDSVVNTATGSALTPLSYGGGTKRWYQVDAAGIISSATNVVRVYFKYGNCSPDSVVFRSGWNCASFPNPDPDAETCANDSLFLKVIPANSQIQLSIERQPGGGSTHALCSTDSMILRVNSAQDANVADPEIDIILPIGVTIGSPVRVEYPNGSGMFQTVIPTPVAGGMKISLQDHTGIGTDGINGLIANPSALGRQARVIIPYNTDCDHISGATFGLQVFGDKPCGDPAVGNGETSNTNGINITGASTPGGLGVTMTIPNDTFRCGVIQTLTLSTTPVIAGTQVGDTVFYILPEGTVYEGNFVSGSNCGTCTASSEPGSAPNTTVVKVALQPGVASGLVIDYSFDVGVGNTGSCGDTRIEAEVRREIAPLTCSTLPPPSLCGRSTVIAGTGSKDVVVARAELSIPTYDAANNYPYGSPYQYIYWGTISNSALVASGNTITINTYFDRNQNGQYDRLLDTFIQSTIVNGPIGAGQTVSFADTFVSTTQPPSPSRPLFSVIDTADGNCLCAGFAPSPFLNALPVDWLSISAENDDNQIGLIKWSTAAEYNTLMFEVYRSIDGVTFQKVGEEKAKGTTQTISRYMFPDDIANLGNGKVYYKLKQIDNNGDYSWSQVVDLTKENKSSPITVVPNPANGQIKLSLNSVQSGSYVAEVLDVTGKLVYSWNVIITELSNSVNLDVTVLPVGVYTLRVNNQSIKLLIKR